jgi:[protein-PII] uridylyltransferase
VLMDSKASNRYTVIEINAMDRPGLLYALTTALYAAKVTIHSAHIATFGERAVDVFYVTDLTNDKIVSSSRLKTLEKRLLEAATGVAALAAVAA